MINIHISSNSPYRHPKLNRSNPKPSFRFGVWFFQPLTRTYHPKMSTSCDPSTFGDMTCRQHEAKETDTNPRHVENVETNTRITIMKLCQWSSTVFAVPISKHGDKKVWLISILILFSVQVWLEVLSAFLAGKQPCGILMSQNPRYRSTCHDLWPYHQPETISQ